MSCEVRELDSAMQVSENVKGSHNMKRIKLVKDKKKWTIEKANFYFVPHVSCSPSQHMQHGNIFIFFHCSYNTFLLGIILNENLVTVNIKPKEIL